MKTLSSMYRSGSKSKVFQRSNRPKPPAPSEGVPLRNLNSVVVPHEEGKIAAYESLKNAYETSNHIVQSISNIGAPRDGISSSTVIEG